MLVRVPLIARVPGAAAGHAVAEPVELFDLMATVLKLAGIEPAHPHWARSLVPQLQGTPGDPERTVYAEGGADPARRGTTYVRGPESIYHKGAEARREHPGISSPTVMLRNARHKLVYQRDDQCELYDVLDDPRELVNLYGDPAHAAVRDALERQLLHWYMDTSTVASWEEDPRVTPTYDRNVT